MCLSSFFAGIPTSDRTDVFQCVRCFEPGRLNMCGVRLDGGNTQTRLGPLSCTAHKLRKAASICRTNRAPTRTGALPLFWPFAAPPGVIHVPRYSAHPSLAIHLNLKHFHGHKGFKHGRDKRKDFCISILFLLSVFLLSSRHCVV